MKKKLKKYWKKIKKLRKKNKGFTLIELLAVVVIIAVLIAIAIPAVQLITASSRKKILEGTINSYITTMEHDLVNGEHDFTEKENTIFAIPIECIDLEQGGSDPFGEWLQASNEYWAYVLIQYNKPKEKYIYGFTFKDSARYGLFPTNIEGLKQKKSKIKVGLQLRQPETGSYLNIAEKENWTGFSINDETQLVVLEAAQEGQDGDWEKTCTLCQKGKNYDEQVSENNDKLLYNIVKDSVSLGKGKQYIGKGYNSNPKNIYFYDAAGSNNILFANYCWKIIRTTGTGGVKLIYNGEPTEEGVCNNVGSETQIGRTEFNEYSTSLADVGYMNGPAWEYESENVGNRTRPYRKRYIGRTYYYYSKDVTYSNGQYTLNNAIYRLWSYDYNSLPGYYICNSGSGKTCSEVFYVIDALNSTYAGGVSLSDGAFFEDVGNTVTFGTSITKNASGQYTLQNTVNVERKTLNTEHASYRGFYMCHDEKSTTCDEVYYIYYSGSDSFTVFLDYFTSDETYKFGKSYTYSNGEYTLSTTKNEFALSPTTLADYHYTCFNSSGKCSELYYIYYINRADFYYMQLENGLSINDLKNAMLTSNSSNSSVKSYIDEWYEDTMTGYTNKLEDTVFCNNRTISTPGGWDENKAELGTHLKFYSYDNNDLTCNNKADQFTVSSSIGNGKLTYPVGLITAPEARMWESRASGAKYWTMSAFGYGDAAGHVYQVFPDGKVDFDRVTNWNAIRPVISLKPETVITDGDGSPDTPYIID